MAIKIRDSRCEHFGVCVSFFCHFVVSVYMYIASSSEIQSNTSVMLREVKAKS